MTKVIYTNELMEWVKNWLKMDHYYHPDEKQNDIPISELEDIIKRMPTADVAPIKHGKWISGNPICPCCGGDKFKDLDADIWADWQPKYCPNCGARMDAGEDE